MPEVDPALSGGAPALDHTSPLAGLLPGFQPRPQQQVMAAAVASALNGGTLLVEAGTGTGKTLAYLLPALQSGRRVVISTGTRTLQEQLFHQDLPLVREALGSAGHAVLLKGRSNYLCRERLQQNLGRGHGGLLAARLAQVEAWAAVTREGDRAELAALPVADPVWSLVTATTEQCLGQACDHWLDCHVFAARRRAREADLVVVNHHLLCADLLGGECAGELLAEAGAVIVDEAHRLPEVAVRFLGWSLSSVGLLALADDLLAVQVQQAPEDLALAGAVVDLEQAVAWMDGPLRGLDDRLVSTELGRREGLRDALAGLERALTQLAGLLRRAAPRGVELGRIWQRLEPLWIGLQDWLSGEGGAALRWLERRGRGFALVASPLEIAEILRGRWQSLGDAWIFTSATLAVRGRFDHFSERLGLEQAEGLCLDSPFDYGRQALAYLPQGLPDPREEDYTQAVVEAAMPVLRASGGRAFFLFTSHRALHRAAARLEGCLGLPLLVQGSAPRSVLLDRFRASGNGVLLGSASFWEGVDVRGAALGCVIIDKLPFAAPDDPLLAARMQAVTGRGGNPFMEVQLPPAVMALKQGVGRLIRGGEDRGVLMVCDPRLYSRNYGRLFRDALPPMPVVRELQPVLDFLAV